MWGFEALGKRKKMVGELCSVDKTEWTESSYLDDFSTNCHAD